MTTVFNAQPVTAVLDVQPFFGDEWARTGSFYGLVRTFQSAFGDSVIRIDEQARCGGVVYTTGPETFDLTCRP